MQSPARNIWVVSVTSFLTDLSSEMIHHLIPLLLANVLGVRTTVIGLIEGIAESTASLVKVFSGTLSDRLGHRKWLAVAGYAISTLVKPGFYFAGSWGTVAGVRWLERAGKGIRAAPRDALLADSVGVARRGLAFGFHRAADTAGAVLGLVVAIWVVARMQGGAIELGRATFQTLVLVSLIPAVLAVVTLAVAAVEVPSASKRMTMSVRFRGLGRRYFGFLGIVSLFSLGNFSDAFLVLRAQERGVNVSELLGMLLVFNLGYALLSTPAGYLSDKIGRPRVLAAGWLLFAATFAGFALVRNANQIWLLYLSYGAYYALCTGTGSALIADLVPSDTRGTAYGTYHAVVGFMSLPASLLAGLLWDGVGAWRGFGPTVPFLVGSGTAVVSAVLLAAWDRQRRGNNE